MRYALIENNTVTNIIEADGADALPGLTLLEALPTTDIGDVLVDGALPQPEPTESEPEAVTPDQKIAHLAAVRWQAEISGTVWNQRGSGEVIASNEQSYTVETDREAQGKYTSELAAVLTGVRIDPSPWKLGGQFVLLSNADFQAIAVAARTHVMACFAAEAAVQSLLGELDSLEAVDKAFQARLEWTKQGEHSAT